MTAPKKTGRTSVICVSQVACDGDPVYAQYADCHRCRQKLAKRNRPPKALKGERLLEYQQQAGK